MNKNNFHMTCNTEKSLYKLWILVKWSFVNEKFPRKKTIYSFNTGPEWSQKKRLLLYIENRKHKIEKAILYDNKSKREIMRFNIETLIMENI